MQPDILLLKECFEDIKGFDKKLRATIRRST